MLRDIYLGDCIYTVLVHIAYVSAGVRHECERVKIILAGAQTLSRATCRNNVNARYRSAVTRDSIRFITSYVNIEAKYHKKNSQCM